MVRLFGVHVLSVRVKFGRDVGSPLPDEEDLTFQFSKSLTVHRSRQTSALPERHNCFVFRFLIEFAFESSTDSALHRGIPLRLILYQRPHCLPGGGGHPFCMKKHF